MWSFPFSKLWVKKTSVKSRQTLKKINKMSEFLDANGNAVEAFTPEEVEGKLEEEREQAVLDTNALREEEIKVLSGGLEEKETELEELRKELAGEKDKDKNLGGQRKVIETKEEEIEKLKVEMDGIRKTNQDEIAGIKKSVSENRLLEMITSITDGDSALEEKIKFHYDNFRGEPKDTKEVKERIKNAYILATDGKPNMNISGSIISGAGSAPVPKTGIPEGKVSPEALSVAKKLGITDQEIKKHKLI